MKDNRQSINYTAVLFGLLLVAAGVITILDLTISGRQWGEYWPVMLIIAGLAIAVRGSMALLIGGAVAIMGAVALTLNLLEVDFPWGIMVPAAVIALGVIIAATAVFRRQRTTAEGGALNIGAIFGGGSYFVSGDSPGGNATAMFGGGEIDFTQATPPPEGIVLDIFCIFGGFEIKVPDDWQVESGMLALFGGVESKPNRNSAATNIPHKLTLTGTVLFGGIEIKQVPAAAT